MVFCRYVELYHDDGMTEYGIRVAPSSFSAFSWVSSVEHTPLLAPIQTNWTNPLHTQLLEVLWFSVFFEVCSSVVCLWRRLLVSCLLLVLPLPWLAFELKP